LDRAADMEAAADAFAGGKIVLLRLGSIYSLIINPQVKDLADKLNLLKERRGDQIMSVVCTSPQAKKNADKSRVNGDFYNLPDDFAGRVIVRIPVAADGPLPFPYHIEKGTMQYLSFEGTHPLRETFGRKIAERGCDYAAITSANIGGAPTIEDIAPAKKLALLFNIKSEFACLNAQTVVAEIPGDAGGHRGSLAIVSFCNKDAIEVKRLADKNDRRLTEKYLADLFANIKTETPLVYAL
ncbi:MAG: hypothetical protein FWE82_03690, partial [Defluviitaleaceae bacterium]|nr:hypothetical protein [Defluviitaleaceae bacterium]